VEGYPGDYRYREFYRDIGFDLDYEYIRPYVAADGKRINTGIKYHRITGPTNHKEPYVRSAALEAAADHAGNFMYNREKQVEFLHGFMGRQPIVVAPYDAELFGHWWYEGPAFLDFLVRKMAYDQDTVRLVTPTDYLRMYPVNQVSTPSMSSWGWKGYSETWLSGANDWVYPHLHKATLRMGELADRYAGRNGTVRRALQQATRELFLAQSSDWAFIMHTGTMVPYAVKRTREHLHNFNGIYEGLNAGSLDMDWLSSLESRNNVFGKVEPALFRS
jgi:1,4-alpha-glucan branching enzyme